MDTSTQEFRTASYLPPVSVCLLLAVASVLLLCSRTEMAGDESSAANLGPRTEGSSEPTVSAEQLRILAWLHEAESQLTAGEPERSAETLRQAADLAETVRVARDVRAEIQLALAQSLDAAGEHDAAIEVWWRLLSMSSSHEEVTRGLAASLQASGRSEEARRVYREMLHADFVADEPPPDETLSGR